MPKVMTLIPLRCDVPGCERVLTAPARHKRGREHPVLDVDWVTDKGWDVDDDAMVTCPKCLKAGLLPTEPA